VQVRILSSAPWRSPGGAPARKGYAGRVVDGTYRRIADSELERHRGDLLYADRQLQKKGEYETVTTRLRRRKYVALCVVIVAAALMVFLGDVLNRIWALAMIGYAVHDYVQAKRTHELIQRLAREQDGRTP
jgi:hypothetical protein